MDKFRDFDWSSRLALSSDRVSQLKEPILQLKIQTERAGEIVDKQMELSEADVKLLLSKLMDARKALD